MICVSTGIRAYWAIAVRTAMIKDIENAAAVSGIVTVSPGISIFGKESRKSVSHLLLIRNNISFFYNFHAHKNVKYLHTHIIFET